MWWIRPCGLQYVPVEEEWMAVEFREFKADQWRVTGCYLYPFEGRFGLREHIDSNMKTHVYIWDYINLWLSTYFIQIISIGCALSG